MRTFLLNGHYKTYLFFARFTGFFQTAISPYSPRGSALYPALCKIVHVFLANFKRSSSSTIASYFLLQECAVSDPLKILYRKSNVAGIKPSPVYFFAPPSSLNSLFAYNAYFFAIKKGHRYTMPFWEVFHKYYQCRVQESNL